MDKGAICRRIKEQGIIAAIRSLSADEAIRASAAVCAGGLNIIEISLACANGLGMLRAVIQEHGSSAIVGAGSVTNVQGVASAAAAGAQFIVTPGFDLGAVAKANELGIAIFAGALTPTEVQIASASGADAVKLFPCFANGDARYLRALRGQYPTTDLIASGGVGLHNCAEYIRAGACAIGVGGEIVDSDTVAAGRYQVFTVRAKRMLKAVRDTREQLASGSQTYNESLLAAR